MSATAGWEPFASVDDLEARFRPLSLDEKTRAGTLLKDASALIRDECPRWAQACPDSLVAVCCQAVIRRMVLPDSQVGVSTTQQTAGSFSESLTYANPMGDLYLTRSERRRLGGGRQHGFHMEMTGV